MKSKELTPQQYEELGEAFNKIIEDLTHLQRKVPTYIGLTKTRKMSANLDRAREKISSVRFDIEDIMLSDNPESPVITSFRKYRQEN